MVNKVKRNASTATKVQKVAQMAGKSRRYVYMVINGERNNDEIFRAYMMLTEGENKLLKAVKELVHF